MRKIFKALNTEVQKLTKIDYLILGIILLTYSLLSFINLGSFKNPQTFYTFNQNEAVVFDFADLKDVIRIKFYNGELSGKYELYVSSDNKDFTYIKELTGNGSFAWNEEKILKRVKYVKLLALDDKTDLGEVAFYDNSKNLIPIKKITTSINNKNNKTKTLVDERKMIPKEINYLNSTYFDEIYFARTAYDYANNIETYEWTHPPLGKIIQAIPIKISGTMAPFYYRLMGNVAGIIMIAVMYVFGASLFKKRKYAIFSSLLMYFDCFHFTQTRMGTVDSFLVLFILLSFYFMYQYLAGHEKSKNLFLSGIFFGLATSVKWTGMLAGLGLAILYFIDMIKKKDKRLELIGLGFLFFVFIPLGIYLSFYLLFPNNKIAHTSNLPGIIKQTEAMYNYHSTLEATHPFSSSWYTWPISYKPVWYYSNKIDNSTKETIVGIGNIAIWWPAIITFIYTFIMLIKKKEKEALVIVIGTLSLWLPYLFIGRCMFLYHYFPVLPFIMLSIIYFFKDMSKHKTINILLPIYLLIIIGVFIIYYPALSGKITSISYLEALKLLKSWIF